MPIITITSEIGYKDFLIGAIKGSILSINQSFTIVDITHNLTPFQFSEAAYVCKGAIGHFPPGSFHLILSNIYHTPVTQLLVVKSGNQYIGIADNGLISMIFENSPIQVFSLPVKQTENNSILYFVTRWTEVFDQILSGSNLEDLGIQTDTYKRKEPILPLVGPNYLEGNVIFIDEFQNLVINITKKTFEEVRNGRSFKIIFKRNEVIYKISSNYSDVQEGEKLALFNTAGYLEIAVNKGKGAFLFGLQTPQTIAPTTHPNANSRLFYQMVRIIFE
jgi:S-adenosyl-L-methionine hydrolase (adenosine-forming)